MMRRWKCRQIDNDANIPILMHQLKYKHTGQVYINILNMKIFIVLIMHYKNWQKEWPIFNASPSVARQSVNMAV